MLYLYFIDYIASKDELKQTLNKYKKSLAMTKGHDKIYYNNKKLHYNLIVFKDFN